jgi:hypothetical protein
VLGKSLIVASSHGRGRKARQQAHEKEGKEAKLIHSEKLTPLITNPLS